MLLAQKVAREESKKGMMQNGNKITEDIVFLNFKNGTIFKMRDKMVSDEFFEQLTKVEG